MGYLIFTGLATGAGLTWWFLIDHMADCWNSDQEAGRKKRQSEYDDFRSEYERRNS